jgi:hypothetical protein
MGQCLLAGWTENQFWKSSYRAVFNLVYSIQKKEEAVVRQNWEQTRLICQHIIAPYRKPGQDGKVFDLPWDSDIQLPREETEEERAQREKYFERLDRLMTRKNAS